MTIFTAAGGKTAAERLAAEQQAIAERLINLDGHLGRRLLDSTALEGVTLARRIDVLADVARLWTLYETYKSVAEEVRAIMARRSRPTRSDLLEVEELVTGATVALPHPDGSLRCQHTTLPELLGEIHTVYGRVHEVVTAVDRVWAELSPRFDRCDTLLREARTVAADLGLVADQDQPAALLTQLANRLDIVRRIALTDPLLRWIDSAVDLAEADQLISRCKGALTDLRALEGLRQHAARRLKEVAAALIKVHRLTQEIAEERRRVDDKIHTVSGRERPVQLADPLGPRLSVAQELCRSGRWQTLATELPALEEEASATLARAEAQLAQTGLPLRERGELRGRLNAYRAKAARLGRIEDLDLEQRYRQARELLWCSPCDLARAAVLVAEYQDAVNATEAHGDGT
jgi:hypothetical protein